MRVTVFTASILLTTALVSISALATATPAKADGNGGVCVCDEKAKAKPVKRSTVRKTERRVAAARPARQASYYDYGSAGRWQSEWHGEWRVAPNMGPSGGYYEEGAVYGPPADEFAGGYDEMAGLQIDRGGWSGGVGGDPEGGGGGGGGFGQLHFGLGGNQENGPTYNNYNQSFQYNPSQAAPFRPRLMGGFAPTK